MSDSNTSIITWKIKHNRDFSSELSKAEKIVNYCYDNVMDWVENDTTKADGSAKPLLSRYVTSKKVKHFGVPSNISEKLMKKYLPNKIKTIKEHKSKLIKHNEINKIVFEVKKLSDELKNSLLEENINIDKIYECIDNLLITKMNENGWPILKLFYGKKPYENLENKFNTEFNNLKNNEKKSTDKLLKEILKIDKKINNEQTIKKLNKYNNMYRYYELKDIKNKSNEENEEFLRLKKIYCKDPKIVLQLNGKGIQHDEENNKLKIKSLNLELNIKRIVDTFGDRFIKFNSIEISEEYAHVSFSIKNNEPYQPTTIVGIDLNSTKYITVLGNLNTGKVLKFGKSAPHIRKKYKNIRGISNKNKKTKLFKRLSGREKNIMKTLNHQISAKIIKHCLENKSIIVLEDLTGIRTDCTIKGKSKSAKNSNHTLNSWSYYQLQTMIEYKAKIHGVPVSFIQPHYTSQLCSKCGMIGTPTTKKFECKNCGHSDHRDVNAAFNIALVFESMRSICTEKEPSMEGTTCSPVDKWFKNAKLFIELPKIEDIKSLELVEINEVTTDLVETTVNFG